MTGEGKPRRTDPARRGSAGASSAPPDATGSGLDITLRAMRFHALVGILEHEGLLPQPLEVDLTVRCRSATGIVDYRRLYDVVAGVVTSGPIDYLEVAAERIARAVLADERIARVRVAVRKPHVALPGPLAYAEVALERQRGVKGR
jgi:dihydroneopterin aldolase